MYKDLIGAMMMMGMCMAMMSMCKSSRALLPNL